MSKNKLLVAALLTLAIANSAYALSREQVKECKFESKSDWAELNVMSAKSRGLAEKLFGYEGASKMNTTAEAEVLKANSCDEAYVIIADNLRRMYAALITINDYLK